MARYKLTLAYDGAGFAGSQRQAHPRTVQGELEKALQKLGWKGRSILMSGRTDTGVHATGQVASADLNWSHSDEELLCALNSILPGDMAVRSVQAVGAEFHPRFDATSRRYRYRLFCQSLRDPLRERFSWRVWPGINPDALSDAAKQFIGTHDFSAFGSPTTPKGTTVRTVMKAEWTQVAEDEWHFEVWADAFLYRMVRRMVFIQAAVAQGKVPAESIARSLANQVPVAKRSVLPSGLAPAHGLTLVEVEYKSQESIVNKMRNGESESVQVVLSESK
ncbi:MAG: tRNA pseudouridine(38-40) synthase TruA [Anaerolineales bacterium]|nr:tRNA pseudouridine(38-40) synthase TruA [Anaerolineae bacterium]PWB75915.1 MAG: tRNA pseudouridine(38-40) synthase TruA [Anaerolineales bacterium]